MSKTQTQKHAGITWIDITHPTRAELDILAEEYGFLSSHVEESLARGQLPQAEVEKNYVFVLLRYPNVVKAGAKISTCQVAVFLGKNYILTVHEDKVPSIAQLYAACEHDEGQRKLYFKKSPTQLLYAIIRYLLTDLADLMPPIAEEMDDLEDRVFDNKGSEVLEIGQLRHKIMKVRRITAALRTMLDDLTPSIHTFTGEDVSHHHRHNVKLTKRLWETVEEAAETIEIYKDADFTANTEKTNSILAVLTLMFTLTIPATVIGTFYGMNVVLPGGRDMAALTFLGAYTSFKLIVGASIAGGLAMLWYFRHRRWF